VREICQEKIEKANELLTTKQANTYFYMTHNIEGEGTYTPLLANQLVEKGIYSRTGDAVNAITKVISADFTGFEKSDDYVIYSKKGGGV